MQSLFTTAIVCSRQAAGILSQNEIAGSTAAHVLNVRDSIKPRDALEEMLISQMMWTHGRLQSLTLQATQRELSPATFQLIHEACDRTNRLYLKQLLALAEYRRPGQQRVNVSINQVIAARQQVIQGGAADGSEPKDSFKRTRIANGNPKARIQPHRAGA